MVTRSVALQPAHEYSCAGFSVFQAGFEWLPGVTARLRHNKVSIIFPQVTTRNNSRAAQQQPRQSRLISPMNNSFLFRRSVRRGFPLGAVVTAVAGAVLMSVLPACFAAESQTPAKQAVEKQAVEKQTVAAPLVQASTTMPLTSPSGWTRIYAEDFLVDAPIGSFRPNTNGRLNETGSAHGSYGARITTYPDGWDDTNHGAKYYPSKVLSVSNSCLDMYLHSQEIDGKTSALSATVSPILPNPPGATSGSLYGRFSARMRITGTPSEYGGVWLLWQDRDIPQWPAQGEIDFPEGDFGGNMNAYAHYANSKGGQDIISTSSRWSWQDWHVVTTEWMPGSLKFFIDGILVGTSTKQVPSTSMHYLFQCGAHSQTPIPLWANGHVQIDWIVVEKPAK